MIGNIFQVVLLFFSFFMWSEFAEAQLNGERAPRKRGRVTLGFQSDTLHENPDDRTNERQRIIDADVDINFYKSKKYTLTLGGRVESFDTGINDLRVGNDDVLVDNLLTNQVFTVSGKKVLNDKGKSLGVSLSYGSASDNSFGREKDSALNLTATYSFSKNEKSQWLILANYSNNRAFLNNIPLPTFVYLYMPSKYFVATLGFPFVSLNWMDYKSYSYKIFLTPAGAGVDFSWRLFGPAMLFTKFTYEVSTFMHENRTREEDRLFYENKEFKIGLKSHLSKKVQLSLGGGYSFDRKIYEGEGIFDKNIKKQNLTNDLFIRTNLVFKF